MSAVHAFEVTELRLNLGTMIEPTFEGFGFYALPRVTTQGARCTDASVSSEAACEAAGDWDDDNDPATAAVAREWIDNEYLTLSGRRCREDDRYTVLDPSDPSQFLAYTFFSAAEARAACDADPACLGYSVETDANCAPLGGCSFLC